MHRAFKAKLLTASEDASNSLATVFLFQAAAKAAFLYALGFLLPVNGSRYSLNDI
jgi:hypothetical protein